MEEPNSNQSITPPIKTSHNPSPEKQIIKPKLNLPLILSILALLLVVGVGGYYMGSEQNKNKTVTSTTSKDTASSSPTITPAVTETKSTSEVHQGDWTIKYLQPDVLQDIHLINSKTNVDKVIGQTDVIAPGKQVIITKDSSTVIFLTTSGNDKLDGEGVSFYSIPQDKVVRTITLRDIKAALPSLSIPRNAALNSLLLSPNGDKIAMSYGYTYELDSESDILVIDLKTYKMSTVSAKGVLKDWKDNQTLQYQVTETATSNDKLNIVTKEVTVN